jgi:hypothetical protein
MAHFAELDANNIVQRVIVISNADIVDGDGVEQESLGIAVCQAVTGGGTWVQTSYNNNFRKKYAGVGDKFVFDANLFYNPVGPYPSWVLDDNYDWQPPTPQPEPVEGSYWVWNEETVSWDSIEGEQPRPDVGGE